MDARRICDRAIRDLDHRADAGLAGPAHGTGLLHHPLPVDAGGSVRAVSDCDQDLDQGAGSVFQTS